MAELNMTFDQYVEWFKSLLVDHYWTVTQAYDFDGEKLRESYKLNLHKDEAFERIFNQKPYVNHLPYPI